MENFLYVTFNVILSQIFAPFSIFEELIFLYNYFLLNYDVILFIGHKEK